LEVNNSKFAIGSRGLRNFFTRAMDWAAISHTDRFGMDTGLLHPGMLPDGKVSGYL
jgi:hypothetical protein